MPAISAVWLALTDCLSGFNSLVYTQSQYFSQSVSLSLTHKNSSLGWDCFILYLNSMTHNYASVLLKINFLF